MFPVSNRDSATTLVMGAGFLITFALVTAQAVAANVNFDDVAGNNNAIVTTATSGGYLFTSTHFHIADNPSLCGFGGCVSNGTNYAGLDAPTLAGPVTMTVAGGGLFALTSFDGAELWLNDAAASAGGFGNASLIRVVGNLLNGGTISQDFALDGIKDGAGGLDDFQSFVFGGAWTNLTSAIWSGYDAAGLTASMAFDNIDASRVPEPGTLALLGLGLAGLGLSRRRKA